jgi:hypothetical protein
MLSFYAEGLLTLHPTPKLEDHPLSFVCGCLEISITKMIKDMLSMENYKNAHMVTSTVF